MLVNQPIVRDRSAPGITSSCRPWPSRRTSTSAVSVPRRARQARRASARPVSSPSSAPPRTSAGTAVSRSVVSSAGSSTSTWVSVRA
ncbi:Uncharacterised protein [Mycobacteroides abscessus subsp. abscessus]|nr:Uncharacterised protein [Mycobacteroides abscessus subsp. abscessus]